MASITVIVVVVIAVITIAIFGLAWIAYSSCIKRYKLEIMQGKYDKELLKEFSNKDKYKKIVVKALCYTTIAILLAVILTLFIIGITYKINGEIFSINDKLALVIKSPSMADYYNNELEQKYSTLGYGDYRFDTGDICIFEKATDLTIGEVYGYKYKNIIITHRLIDIINNYDSENNVISTYYIFRGDNNPSKDVILVKADNILYHYTGEKIKYLGSIILYAQSYLGIWSIISVLGISISTDIVICKIKKVGKKRALEIEGIDDDK